MATIKITFQGGFTSNYLIVRAFQPINKHFSLPVDERVFQRFRSRRSASFAPISQSMEFINFQKRMYVVKFFESQDGINEDRIMASYNIEAI